MNYLFKMKTLFNIFLILTVLLSTSCSTQKKCARLVNKYNKLEEKQERIETKLEVESCEFKKEVNIETVTELDTVYKLDSIFIWNPPMILKDTLEIPCPEKVNVPKKVKKENGITLTTEIIDSKLLAECEADSLKKVIVNKERQIKQVVSKTEKEKRILKEQTDKWRLVAITLLLIILFGIGVSIFRAIR